MTPLRFRKLCACRDRLLTVNVDDNDDNDNRDNRDNGDRDEGGEESVDAIAARVGLSRFQLIREFAGLFGTTPHQLRIDAKMERAKSLLASGRAVTDVAVEVGFASLSTFSGTFRRRVGTSPSEFRRRAFVVFPPLRARGCYGLLALLPPNALRTFEEAGARALR